MSKLKATHRSKNGKYLYRLVPRKKYMRFLPLDTGVEFWCEYQLRWNPSIMRENELIEL